MDLFKYILIVCSSFLISGCYDSTNSELEALKLQSHLMLRDNFSQQADSFIQGESIEFFLTLTNTSNKEIRLNFNDGQQYDFYINSSPDTEVWRWSDDKGFTLALTNLTLQVGETAVVSQIWDQTLAGGDSIPTGSYVAYGSFLDQTLEAQFSFTIQ